jgi:hypothetical protein
MAATTTFDDYITNFKDKDGWDSARDAEVDAYMKNTAYDAAKHSKFMKWAVQQSLEGATKPYELREKWKVAFLNNIGKSDNNASKELAKFAFANCDSGWKGLDDAAIVNLFPSWTFDVGLCEKFVKPYISLEYKNSKHLESNLKTILKNVGSGNRQRVFEMIRDALHKSKISEKEEGPILGRLVSSVQKDGSSSTEEKMWIQHFIDIDKDRIKEEKEAKKKEESRLAEVNALHTLREMVSRGHERSLEKMFEDLAKLAEPERSRIFRDLRDVRVSNVVKRIWDLGFGEIFTDIVTQDNGLLTEFSKNGTNEQRKAILHQIFRDLECLIDPSRAPKEKVFEFDINKKFLDPGADAAAPATPVKPFTLHPREYKYVETLPYVAFPELMHLVPEARSDWLNVVVSLVDKDFYGTAARLAMSVNVDEAHIRNVVETGVNDETKVEAFEKAIDDMTLPSTSGKRGLDDANIKRLVGKIHGLEGNAVEQARLLMNSNIGDRVFPKLNAATALAIIEHLFSVQDWGAFEVLEYDDPRLVAAVKYISGALGPKDGGGSRIEEYLEVLVSTHRLLHTAASSKNYPTLALDIAKLFKKDPSVEAKQNLARLAIDTGTVKKTQSFLPDELSRKFYTIVNSLEKPTIEDEESIAYELDRPYAVYIKRFYDAVEVGDGRTALAALLSEMPSRLRRFVTVMSMINEFRVKGSANNAVKQNRDLFPPSWVSSYAWMRYHVYGEDNAKTRQGKPAEMEIDTPTEKPKEKNDVNSVEIEPKEKKKDVNSVEIEPKEKKKDVEDKSKIMQGNLVATDTPKKGVSAVEDAIANPAVEDAIANPAVEDAIANPAVEDAIANPAVEDAIANPAVEDASAEEGESEPKKNANPPENENEKEKEAADSVEIETTEKKAAETDFLSKFGAMFASKKGKKDVADTNKTSNAQTGLAAKFTGFFKRPGGQKGGVAPHIRDAVRILTNFESVKELVEIATSNEALNKIVRIVKEAGQYSYLFYARQGYARLEAMGAQLRALSDEYGGFDFHRIAAKMILDNNGEGGMFKRNRVTKFFSRLSKENRIWIADRVAEEAIVNRIGEATPINWTTAGRYGVGKNPENLNLLEARIRYMKKAYAAGVLPGEFQIFDIEDEELGSPVQKPNWLAAALARPSPTSPSAAAAAALKQKREPMDARYASSLFRRKPVTLGREPLPQFLWHVGFVLLAFGLLPTLMIYIPSSIVGRSDDPGSRATQSTRSGDFFVAFVVVLFASMLIVLFNFGFEQFNGFQLLANIAILIACLVIGCISYVNIKQGDRRDNFEQYKPVLKGTVIVMTMANLIVYITADMMAGNGSRIRQNIAWMMSQTSKIDLGSSMPCD